MCQGARVSDGVSDGRVRLVYLIILYIVNTINADSVTTTIPPIDKSEGNREGTQLLELVERGHAAGRRALVNTRTSYLPPHHHLNSTPT